VTNPQKWCTPARARSRYTCDLEKANGRDAGSVLRAASVATSNADACAHRSAHLQRHRQCVFQRDPAAARLSPLQLTTNLDDSEVGNLHRCVRRSRAIGQISCRGKRTARSPSTSRRFIRIWPSTAQGRFGKPCPRCGSPIQRIAYANNECNYCATCQTGGKLLADRALSRLLGEDWP
jgi:Zinc finger found in FPG and IleRS